MLAWFSPPAGKNGTGYYFSGGTSASTPTFAGIVALVQQKLGTGSLGNINPVLYALAAQSPSAFHDVTTGNNIVPCQPGVNGCPAAGHYGFSAGPGYDLATGLGSVDAKAFVDAWVACEATQCAAMPDGGSSSSSGSASSSSGAGGSTAGSSSSSSSSSGGTGGSTSSSSSSSDGGGSGTGSPGARSGCSCHAAGDPAREDGPPLALVAVTGLVLGLRRRPRRTASMIP